MRKRIVITLASIIINVLLTASANGQCINTDLEGQWKGVYTMKPRVFGMSMGFCEYETSMRVLSEENGQYRTIIETRMVDGKGRAGKKCQPTVVMHGTLQCVDNDVQLVTKETPAGALNIRSTLSNGMMNSEGDFKMKHGAYKVKVEYQWDMAKQHTYATVNHK